MSANELSLGIALGAGLLSFFSPCVLPMVPIYLGYLAGDSIAGADEAPRRTPLIHAALFVLGFGLVFVLLGAAAGLLGQLLARHLSLLVNIGGLLLIVLGMHMAGLLRIPWLYTSKSLVSGRPRGVGPAASFLLGLVFAAGWTPCVGPVLGAILLLAADAQTAARGGLLLSVYALGLGLPFVAVAAAMGALLPVARRLNRYARWASLAGGILLILLGFAMVTGLYGRFLGGLPLRF
jgi:cytochrome c-type biogenesis protein